MFTIDSAKVTSIKIYSKGKADDILTLSGMGKNWNISYKNKTYPADTNSIRQILSTLKTAIPERVAGNDKSTWKDFEVTDSVATRVVVEQGKEITADFRVGKISMSQGNQNQGYGGRQGMNVKSHIRVAGDDRVYVINGFLSLMFRDQPAAYRNRIVCRLNKSLLTKLTFVYPGDSSFVIQRQGTGWISDNKPADSARTETFLSALSSSSNSEFAEDNNQPYTFPYSVKIEGNNMQVVELNGAIDNVTKRYFIKSSLNPGAVFGSTSPSLFSQIFPGKNKFEPSVQKDVKGKNR